MSGHEVINILEQSLIHGPAACVESQTLALDQWNPKQPFLHSVMFCLYVWRYSFLEETKLIYDPLRIRQEATKTAETDYDTKTFLKRSLTWSAAVKEQKSND